MKSILKAVIVDDEKDLCFLLEQILTNKNFDTTSLNTLSDASDVLVEINPAVVFLDNQLPDGFGINFIPEIKRVLPDTKVVIMTAYSSDNDEKEAVARGADVFLKKPLSVGMIESTLSKLTLRKAV